MRDLRPEQNERIRQEMRSWIERTPKGSRTKLAKKIGVKQPSISQFLNGGGISYAMAKRFALMVGKPELLADEGMPASEPVLRYPNMGPALAMARGENFSQAFLDEYSQQMHDLDGDVPPSEWWIRIQRRYREWLEMRRPVGNAAIVDADEARTQPKKLLKS